MSDTITGAKRRRGTVRGRLTRIERDIATLEAKEGLTPADQRKVKRLKEQVKETDREYEERHVQVLDFINEEDKETLDSEEAVFEKHVDRVSDILERLEQLKEPAITTEPVTIPTPSVDSARPGSIIDGSEPASGSMKTQKRLRHLRSRIEKAYGTVRKLEPTPDLDVCLVEKMKGDIDGLTKKLSDIVEDILSLPEDDPTSLDETSSMEDELGSMKLKLIKLEHDREHRIVEDVSASPRVRLPKTNFPRQTFQRSTERF